jgi:hypothetical protein
MAGEIVEHPLLGRLEYDDEIWLGEADVTPKQRVEFCVWWLDDEDGPLDEALARAAGMFDHVRRNLWPITLVVAQMLLDRYRSDREPHEPEYDVVGIARRIRLCYIDFHTAGAGYAELYFDDDYEFYHGNLIVAEVGPDGSVEARFG